jgi:glycosyltransferase involved in cell wall biosynthesis
MSLLTIAIPFYNSEKYLYQAVESVLNQTYQDFKLLLIDDGSSDSSLQIAKYFQKSDSRVFVFSDGENRNLGYRLNQIPSLTDSEFLARMDADDIMHPQRIEKQINYLIDHPEIDVLGTNAYAINENNFVIGVRFKNFEVNKVKNVLGFIHPTIIAKRDWFINNLYDVRALRIEDYDLWYRTSGKYNFQMLNQPLLFYREYSRDNYKKYVKGLGTSLYLIRKHSFNPSVLNKFVKYYFNCFLLFVFNLFGQEGLLIARRNEVRINKVSFENYFV